VPGIFISYRRRDSAPYAGRLRPIEHPLRRTHCIHGCWRHQTGR